MTRFAIAVSTFMLAASIAVAQTEWVPQYDATSVSGLIDKVHSDLTHAYQERHFSGDDRDRLNHSEKELREFAGKWEHGHFDKGQLSGVIDGIQRVLDKNKLKGADRDSIDQDLLQMRNMREAYEHHDIEGARH